MSTQIYIKHLFVHIYTRIPHFNNSVTFNIIDNKGQQEIESLRKRLDRKNIADQKSEDIIGKRKIRSWIDQ